MRYYIARICGGDYFCLASRAAMRSSSSCRALMTKGNSLPGLASSLVRSSLLITRPSNHCFTVLLLSTCSSSCAIKPVSRCPTLAPSLMFQVNVTGLTSRRKSMPEFRVCISHLSRASERAVIVVTWARMVAMLALPRVTSLLAVPLLALAPLPKIRRLLPKVVL